MTSSELKHRRRGGERNDVATERAAEVQSHVAETADPDDAGPARPGNPTSATFPSPDSGGPERTGRCLADIQKAFGKLNRWLRHRVYASIRLRHGRKASPTALHHLLKQLRSKKTQKGSKEEKKNSVAEWD
jgi:hypothetical protein